jgi:hypothetical protein
MQCLSRSGAAEQVGIPPLHAGNPPAPAAAVNRIAHYGVSHMLQMHSDLMGSAGVQLETQQIDHIESGNHEGVGAGGAAMGYDSHALSILGVSCHRSLDDQRTGVEVSPGQRGIGPANPSGGNRSPQSPVGQISLRDQHQTGGITIQPVNDAGPALGASGQGGAPGDQRVDQGVVPVAWGRMHHQARRLVDHGQVLVFKDDVEGHCAGQKRPRRFGLRKAQGHGLTPGEQPGCPRDFPCDADPFSGNEPGCLGSGESELIAEEAIQTLGLRAENGKLDF